jgi:hypothetical protein
VDSAPVEPSDVAVRSAVAATGDPQLQALIAAPASYVLRPSNLTGQSLTFYHVILVNVAHPVGFLIAFDPESGRTEVTSQRPEAVIWVVSAEPELAPEGVWELVRDPSSQQRLIEAHVEEDGAARRYFFDVEQDLKAVTRWSLTLADHGQWKRVR